MLYQVCSNDDHRLTFDLYTARSILRLHRFYMGKVKKSSFFFFLSFFFFFFFFFQYVFKTNG